MQEEVEKNVEIHGRQSGGKERSSDMMQKKHNIPSAARVAVLDEQNRAYDKPRVSCIDRASDLAGGRGIDAPPAKSAFRNHAYSQRAERNVSPQRPSVAADWMLIFSKEVGAERPWRKERTLHLHQSRQHGREHLEVRSSDQRPGRLSTRHPD